MAYDIIVFGKGFDGELVTVDDLQDTLILNPSKIIQLSGSLSSTYQRMSMNKDISFKIIKHKSNIDGKVYLIAIADESLPNDIDLKISWQAPKPFRVK